MAQRILAVEYALPAAAVVTPECRDLLAQLLVADPAKRISLADVQRHPWFTRDLPPGVAGMNDRLLADPSAYRSSATQACSPACMHACMHGPLYVWLIDGALPLHACLHACMHSWPLVHVNQVAAACKHKPDLGHVMACCMHIRMPTAVLQAMFHAGLQPYRCLAGCAGNQITEATTA